MQEEFLKKKQILQTALAEVVKDARVNQKKSISLIANEIGMTKSMWADLEKEIKDPQISTLWRMAEGLNITLSELVKRLEIKLGNRFTLIDG